LPVGRHLLGGDRGTGTGFGRFRSFQHSTTNRKQEEE